jgi:hypothetical protein
LGPHSAILVLHRPQRRLSRVPAERERRRSLFMDLHVTARRQAGLFSHRQAREAGIPAGMIHRSVACGRWIRVRPRVYAATSTPIVERSRVWAAVLQVGDPVTVGELWAARLWRLDAPIGPVTVLVPQSRRPQGGPDLLVRRRQVPPADRVRLEGLPVTTAERTLVDCLRTANAGVGRSLLEEALQRRLTTLDALWARVLYGGGMHGNARAARTLSTVTAGADSVAEARLHHRLKAAGVGCWVPNVPVSDAHGLVGLVDLLFPAARLVVELDGRAWHIDRESFQRDRSRQNRLVAAGYTVLRFTADDVALRSDYVVSAIKTALGC